jgi:hypothetical protein
MKTSQLLTHRGVAFTIFLAIAAFQAGCATVVDGTTPGVVLYVRGELQANIDRRFEAVERAANRAITDLQFSKIEEKKDALVAIVTARTAEDARITVKVERSTETITTVRIKAGVIGNEKLSRIIFNKIKENL